MNEAKLREEICRLGKSMFDRGLTVGSSGNISVRVNDGWLMTPTNSCLGRLDPASLSKVDGKGTLLSGEKQTKESFLHLSVYGERPSAGAIPRRRESALASPCGPRTVHGAGAP